MNIEDFLPKYPNVEKTEYPVLNPYEDVDFAPSIYSKKEFYENRLEKEEIFPTEKGLLAKHQTTIARYLSSNTPYDRLLLVHQVGCVDPNTPILLWDGKIKKAEYICIGDKLIGDDGNPRTVLELRQGESDMFIINQETADSYTVNKDHILTLYTKGGNIIEIKVSDYLKLSDGDKLELKGYKCSGVNWGKQDVSLDPYTLGVWLGDGFTSLEPELIKHLSENVKSSFLSINNKDIPMEYIINDRYTRLKLLAGLIDTTGDVYNGTRIELSHKNKILSDKICYLTRSLGFSCHQKEIKKSYKILISGIGLEEIPTIIPRKKIYKCKYDKDPLTTELTVSPVGNGKYVGWIIGDNRRFLLGDFTVTHNTGKTCAAIGAIEQIRQENSTINGAVIIALGGKILDNFINELLFKCTAGQYIPKDFGSLTEKTKTARINKKIGDFYEFQHIQIFSKTIKNMRDADIIQHYSNKIIVIDEIHNIRIQPDKKKAETLKIYQSYFRFLHLVQNSKILLLSATPMKDSVEEIATVMNLLLPNTIEDQLPTGEDFNKIFLYSKDGTRYIKQDKIKDLKRVFNGRVSFLRAVHTDIKKEYMGKEIGTLKHFKVSPEIMSDFQSKVYAESVEKDKMKGAGVYNNSIEASLFSFPNETWGVQGFTNYITAKEEKKIRVDVNTNKKLKNEQSGEYKYTNVIKNTLNNNLVSELEGKDNDSILKNIQKYSSKFTSVIKQLLERQPSGQIKGKCCFVYSSRIHGGGAILMGLILEKFFGYSRANGKETSKGLRYALLTGETVTKNTLNSIKNRFNRPDNLYGEYIQVIIGSKTVSEGLSFNHIQLEVILTPHFNYSEIAQALGRGIRLGSHRFLIDAYKKDNSLPIPVIDIMQPVAIPNIKYKNSSIDLHLYQISEDKDISIKRMIRIIMESSFDCALNYFRNNVTGYDNKRECEYTTCEYKCNNIRTNIIKKGLKDSQLDYSTHQLYYTNPRESKIQKKIEQLFRTNITITLDDIINNLKDNFVEDEIRNALINLTEQTKDNSSDFDYKNYIDIYYRSPVKKIIIKIERLFRNHFQLNLNNIVSKLKEFRTFDILTALRTLINESIIINNKYGFPCYLREQNNIYFLADSLVVKNLLSSYYTKYPSTVYNKTYTTIIQELFNKLLPNIIKNVCKLTNKTAIINFISTLEPKIQELFIEASVEALDKKIDFRVEFRDIVLKYFSNFIKKIDNVTVSTVLQKNNILRCYEQGVWKNCSTDYNKSLVTQEDTIKSELREGDLYGTYNPQNNKYCIVDVENEKLGIKQLQDSKENVKTTRSIRTGKNCGSWNLNDLINIMVKRLKIKPPDSYKNTDDIDKLIRHASSNKRIMNIYNNKVDNLDIITLRRALYWGSKKSSHICKSLMTWFDVNKKLYIDNKCGVQGKALMGEKETVEKAPTKIKYTIIEYIPIRDKTYLKEYIDDIQKLMDDCYNVKKYRITLNDDKWYLAYSKKKIVSFLLLQKNKITHLCVASNYSKRKGIATNVMGQLLRKADIYTTELNNVDKNYAKLVKIFKLTGFNVLKNNGKITTFRYTPT
jgi:superfamily II DNA or RNA helicase